MIDDWLMILTSCTALSLQALLLRSSRLTATMLGPVDGMSTSKNSSNTSRWGKSKGRLASTSRRSDLDHSTIPSFHYSTIPLSYRSTAMVSVCITGKSQPYRKILHGPRLHREELGTIPPLPSCDPTFFPPSLPPFMWSFFLPSLPLYCPSFLLPFSHPLNLLPYLLHFFLPVFTSHSPLQQHPQPIPV